MSQDNDWWNDPYRQRARKRKEASSRIDDYQPEASSDLTFTITIPRFLFIIIILNVSAWFFFVPTIIANTLRSTHTLPIMCLSALAVPLYLFLMFVCWRFFWWINAILMTLSTCGMIFWLVMLLYGASSIEAIWGGIPLG